MSEKDINYLDIINSLEFFIKNSSISHFPLSNNTTNNTLNNEVRNENIISDTEKVISPLRVLDSFKDESLDSLNDIVSKCTLCQLHEHRTNVVFGTGCRTSPLIAFVGEGPGEEEDKSGEPFVGPAGQLLNSAIVNGLKLKREDVYICNLIKCRPPGNRNPLPNEISSCSQYLLSQLLKINPRLIVSLGGSASKYLLSSEEGITKLRGKWYEWNGFKVMPTFHPAYILRNPAAKKDFWADLKMVIKELGL